jgi:GDP-L-fucose synthase
MIANNVIHSAYLNKVAKLLFLGSSCIYPRLAPQPIREEALMTGPLEPTNEAYALTKISSLKMCDYYRQQYGCNFISAMPTNLYGINDNFDPDSSHLMPALIKKFHQAKISNVPSVILWGTGKPYREFMFADDLADALLFLMLNYNEPGHVNIGTGIDMTILELAKLVGKIVGYNGSIEHDLSKPDGMPRKQLDVSRIHSMGWRHKIELEEGIKITYEWYKSKVAI